MSNADPIDDAQDRALLDTAKAVEAVRRANEKFVKGEPGICYECGLEFSRTVLGLCGKCRDELSKQRR